MTTVKNSKSSSGGMPTVGLLEKVNAITKKPSQKSSSTSEIITTIDISQLPLWEEHVRGLPNALARSALFTAGNRNAKREYFKKDKIASVKGIEILYTGEELRQEDEDVFLQVVHLARQQPLGSKIIFTGYGLMKELNWAPTKANYVRLRDCLNRLSSTNLIIKTNHAIDRDSGYAGSLIRKFAWNMDAARGTSQCWQVWLEPEIIYLFQQDAYTKVDWSQRLKLPSQAKWLHSFYLSHREPFGYKVETIRVLCKSRIAVLSKFRYVLREALDILVREGFLLSYKIDPVTDVLTVERAPRRSLLPKS
jgi:hypothetical protein